LALWELRPALSAGAFHCLDRRSFHVVAMYCCFSWSCMGASWRFGFAAARGFLLEGIGSSADYLCLVTVGAVVGGRTTFQQSSLCRLALAFVLPPLAVGGFLASSWGLSLGRGGLVPCRSTPRLDLGYPVLQWHLASLVLARGARLGAASFVCWLLMAAWRRVRLWM
jgi:hypothetical protein